MRSELHKLGFDLLNNKKSRSREKIENLRLNAEKVNLGEIRIREESIDHVKVELHSEMQKMGFDLLDNKKSRTIEKIKNLITDLVQNRDAQLDMNLSDYLSGELHQEYSSLSTLFSEVEGMTIEKYFIQQKIEKVKELLVYNELTLSEIAHRLNYSSTAYLSSQFKKVTGLTP